MNATGKEARKSHGTRVAAKRSKKRPGSAKYAEKVKHWVEMEKKRKAHSV